MEKLKPCPFCGCEKVELREQINEFNGNEEFYVLCWNCITRSAEWVDKEDAIEAWNRRV